MKNKKNYFLEIIKLSFFLLMVSVCFFVVNINFSKAQEAETIINTGTNLSQEELAIRREEARAITEVVLLAIKNGALGEQFALNNNTPLVNTENKDQLDKIETIQSGLDNANHQLAKMSRTIIILSCLLITELFMVAFLYYLLLKKYEKENSNN